MPLAVDRRFWAILGVSLLVHGSLFALIAGQRSGRERARALPPLQIRLAGPTAATALPPATRSSLLSESGPAAAPAAGRPQVRQAALREARQATPTVSRPAGPAIVPVPPSASARSAENPAAPAPAPVASTAGEAGAAAPSPHAAPSSAANAPTLAAAPAAGATAASASRPASAVLDGYRARLTALFAGQHDYPRIAAQRGWEGEVRLRLQVARKGQLLAVALDHSSGYDVLDRHALALLESHGDLPPLPEALDASEISVIVPIQYKLRKTT